MIYFSHDRELLPLIRTYIRTGLDVDEIIAIIAEAGQTVKLNDVQRIIEFIGQEEKEEQLITTELISLPTEQEAIEETVVPSTE